MEIKFFQADAFTSSPFKGNPAAVCLLARTLPAEKMQAIAQENNLSETAFVAPVKNREGFELRWFTPKTEIDLCGHATLASAHILWQEKIVPRNKTIPFHTKSGLLTAVKEKDWIQLLLPAQEFQAVKAPAELKKLFGHKLVSIVKSANNYLVEMPTEKEVRDFIPDFEKLKNYRCIITAKGEPDSPFDFVSRFFAFPVGIPEDPVTGSAHCCLAPYWADKLKKKEFYVYQASQRGGILKLKLQDNGVLIGGKAVTVIKGNLIL